MVCGRCWWLRRHCRPPQRCWLLRLRRLQGPVWERAHRWLLARRPRGRLGWPLRLLWRPHRRSTRDLRQRRRPRAGWRLGRGLCCCRRAGSRMSARAPTTRRRWWSWLRQGCSQAPTVMAGSVLVSRLIARRWRCGRCGCSTGRIRRLWRSRGSAMWMRPGSMRRSSSAWRSWGLPAAAATAATSVRIVL